MVIDMHTHAFPDAIAERTISILEKKGGFPARNNGTLAGLKKSMEQGGVDLSLVLPVVTKPSQFESINRFAAVVDKTPGLRSFGGIHPLCENIEEKLDFIRSSGLRGIKIHPDYQETFIDDPAYIEILEGCRRRGLYVTTHAGVDPAVPTLVRCPPERMNKVLKKLQYGKDTEPFIILAHLGGANMYDEVEKYLVGTPVYIDLSFVLPYVPKEQVLRIIRNHGSERILFATDAPWVNQKEYLDYFMSLPLDDRERALILCENAAKILDISFPETGT